MSEVAPYIKIKITYYLLAIQIMDQTTINLWFIITSFSYNTIELLYSLQLHKAVPG